MAKPNLKLIKPDKATNTSVDTILVDKATIKSWVIPKFQRPLRTTPKVLELAEALKQNGGVFPGIITVGILDGRQYLVDGQHRCHAFDLSEIEIGYTDVRYRRYDSMPEMAVDFVELNGKLANMRPDDVLRGLESSSAGLTKLRRECPFVGYDQIRRSSSPSAPVLSMSATLRCWNASSRDAPGSISISAIEHARTFTVEDAEQLTSFLHLALKAWGRDPEFVKLWSNLNLTMTMWLYRHTVMKSFSPKTPKVSRDLFTKCLMALSADSNYLDWLVGRHMAERDRSPAYRRIKQMFSKRLSEELGKKVLMPQPEWSAH